LDEKLINKTNAYLSFTSLINTLAFYL